jgi:hypothetical protein
MKRIGQIFFVTILFLGMACSQEAKSINETRLDVESAGVVIHGDKSNVCIMNTNNFPVWVRKVSWRIFGEYTIWLKIFQFDYKFYEYIHWNNGNHIYYLDGVAIGWLRQ